MPGRFTRPPKDGGETRIVTLADSVGVDWIYEVPAGEIVRVDAVHYVLTLDAGGATRYHMFNFWNPAMGNIDIIRQRYPNMAPGAALRFCHNIGSSDNGQTLRGSATAPQVQVRNDSLPEFQLQAGLRLGGVTSGLTALDVYSGIRLALTVWKV